MGEASQQLLTEATPVAPQLLKTCHANPVQLGASTIYWWNVDRLPVLPSYSEKNTSILPVLHVLHRTFSSNAICHLPMFFPVFPLKKERNSYRTPKA